MRLLLTALLMLAPPLALGQDFQSVDSIRDAAVATVADRGAPGVRAEASVDPHLRLPACPQPLEAMPSTAGTVEVGCASAGWRLYVPVRVQRQVPVVVLTRGVAAGEAIPADALGVEMRDASRMAGGAVSDPLLAQGQVARRGLVAGSVLTTQDIQAVRTVRRGDIVTLVSRAGGIEVRAQGRAMAAAGPRERVSVENTGSRRIVQGVVTESGEVDVLH